MRPACWAVRQILRSYRATFSLVARSNRPTEMSVTPWLNGRVCPRGLTFTLLEGSRLGVHNLFAEGTLMKIGILGAGFIGSTLARKLAEAGHEVKVANSRGPETIGANALTTGATAVEASDVVRDVEVLVTSIPLSRMPGIRPLVRGLPADVVVVDTSNYYPLRDGHVQSLDDGQAESLWISEQVGRPVVKAWNAILSGTFETKGRTPGQAGRLAIPVAADRETDKRTAMSLVEDTGFDAIDAGTLAESWRQQPGAPAYCTELTRDDMPAALAGAEKNLLPSRRDHVMAAIGENFDTLTTDDIVTLNRTTYTPAQPTK